MLTSTEQASTVDFFFAIKSISVNKEGSVESLKTIELVKPEQILASLPLTAATSGETIPAKTTELLPGLHTHFSATGNALLATVAGYPQIKQDINKKGETVIISITPLVTISPDKMEAYLTLYPPLPGSPPIQIEALEELLKQAGIGYGLNREILLGYLEQSQEELIIITEALIAKGSQPIAGQDAHLRFELELGSIPGKIMGDGRIDFHERKMFTSVRKGELIATKVPATDGTAGTNVLGFLLPQQAGQDIKVSTADNAIFNEESGEIRAGKPGIVSVVDNTIRVCSKLTIPGDINFSTGNIEAKDAVDIGGSILPGFQVSAHGDLRIGGGVRSATVISHGNLVIKEGASGKQTTIRISGDADIPFIEQATIIAGGTVIIRRQAYYSRIFAGADIHCQDDSKIIGGITMAGGNLSLGQVGSDNANPALLAAGTDAKQYLRYETLQQEILEKEEELERCLQLHGRNSLLPFRQVMTEELAEMNHDLHKLNLTTGQKGDSPEERNNRLKSLSIKVYDQIFAGTVLRIGNITTMVEKTITARKITLSEDMQELIFHAL